MPIIGTIDSSKSGNLYAASFESIATVTLSSATFGVTFDNIPQTYTHLQIRAIVKSASGSNQAYWMRFNNDATNGSYAWHYLEGNGSAAGSSKEQPSSVILPGPIPSNSGSNFTATVVDILDYSNTNKYKVTKGLTGFNNNGSGSIWFASGLWQSNNAITKIYLQDSSTANFASGTQFALYGIKGVI
jgi:hypothetical protein